MTRVQGLKLRAFAKLGEGGFSLEPLVEGLRIGSGFFGVAKRFESTFAVSRLSAGGGEIAERPCGRGSHGEGCLEIILRDEVVFVFA